MKSNNEIKIFIESDVHMHRTFLEIKNAQKRHTGTYKAIIRNEIGETECISDVNVKGKIYLNNLYYWKKI
jgi:hypothetical protein